MPIGAIAGAGIVGAGAQIFGAQTGAAAQRDAANSANQLSRDQFTSNQQTLAPWINQGQGTNDALAKLLGTNPGGDPTTAALTAKFAPTMEQLAQTPGYQFLLDQGTKSTQNSYASKGLGSSGAAMKGAADYAEGLAGTTYQQQFQNYWSQNKSIYDMLSGQSQQGLSAAGALTGQGMAAANQQGQNIIGAGNATAGANVYSGNAAASGLNSIGQYSLLQSLLAGRGQTNGTGGIVLGGAGGPGQFYNG